MPQMEARGLLCADSEGFKCSEHKPQEHSWALITKSEIHR